MGLTPGGPGTGRHERWQRLWLLLRNALRESWWVPLGGLIVFAAGALLERMATAGEGERHPLPYLAVAVFGTGVGVAELVARYRDRPSAALQALPGITYLAVNAVAAVAVLWCLRTQLIALTMTTVFAPTLNQVLLAGFGSMALFRTSIFTLRVRDTDIAVGPAAVLQVILYTADRACDRRRAGPRASRVQAIMRGVSFERVKKALPLHCAALMQNVPPDEIAQLNQVIAALSAETMSAEIKSYNLGLYLMNMVGEDVLERAVEILGPEIRGPADDDPPILTAASRLPFAEMPALAEICVAIDPMQRPAYPPERLQVDSQVLPHDADKNVVVLSRLRTWFGSDTVVRGIALLDMNKAPVKPVTGSLNLADLEGGDAGAVDPNGDG